MILLMIYIAIGLLILILGWAGATPEERRFLTRKGTVSFMLTSLLLCLFWPLSFFGTEP